jgi:hypothetical protein
MTEWVPVDACTLPTEQQPLRVAEFAALFRDGLRRAERLDRTWLRLTLAATEGRYDTARDLAALETDCCSFFDIAVRNAGPEVVLDVRVPPGREAVLDGLHRQALAASGRTRASDG